MQTCIHRGTIYQTIYYRRRNSEQTIAVAIAAFNDSALCSVAEKDGIEIRWFI